MFRNKRMKIGVALLAGTAVVMALAYLLLNPPHFMHGDKGMYDDTVAITAQIAHTSQSGYSIEEDPGEACGATVESLGLGGRVFLAKICVSGQEAEANINIDLKCDTGRAKVVLFEMESNAPATLAEGNTNFSSTVKLNHGSTYLALIADKADVTCAFNIAIEGDASAQVMQP